MAERPVSTITTRDIARIAGVSGGYAAALEQFDTHLPAAGTVTVEQNLITYAGRRWTWWPRRFQWRRA